MNKKMDKKITKSYKVIKNQRNLNTMGETFTIIFYYLKTKNKSDKFIS